MVSLYEYIGLNKIFKLCENYLYKKQTLHGLSKEEVKQHFYDGEFFLKTILHENVHDKSLLDAYIDEKVCRYEYSGGGCKLNSRGFYHPNPVEELYTNGAKRGHLLKCKKKPQKYDFEYGFDSENHLIKVVGQVNSMLAEMTYIFPYKDFSIAFCFNENISTKECFMQAIELCRYQDNRIQQYYIMHVGEQDFEQCSTQFSIILNDFFYEGKKLILDVYTHEGSAGQFGSYTFVDSFLFELEQDEKYQYLRMENGYIIKERSCCP